MKKIILFAALIALVSFSYGQSGQVKGTGPIVTKTLNLASFTTIECSMAADLEVTQGATQKVEVEGQQNIIDLINTEITENKWKIKTPRGTWTEYDKLKIKVTLPTIYGLGMAGSGSIRSMNTIKTDDFQIGLSGSGKVDLSLEADAVDCGISGSGNVNLKGHTKELVVATSGSGDVTAFDFPASKVKIGMSGSGNIDVNASESLDAAISGSGDVRYKGSPKVKAKVSGSGTVEPRN